MKVIKTVGNLSLEIQADTQKDVFKEIASFEEVFGENVCGKCGSENVRCVVRENDGNEFFEMRCVECSAKLGLGVHKKGGGLFPKRKDADGKYLPDNGWQRWNHKTKTLE
jgi:hypothetical protein